MRLYTIGYEGRTLRALIRELQDSGVERVVDVRLNPHSRQKGFAIMALFEGLRKAGISYEHVKELGNPPEIRQNFFDGEVAKGRRRFRARLENGQAEAVDYLVGLARLQPTAILCRERDFEDCHRSVVADVAAERAKKLEIVHL